MKNYLLFIGSLLMFSMNIFSQKIEKIKLTELEIPKEYKLTENSQCKSIQANLLFKNPEMYEMIYGKIKSKEIQNFKSSQDSGSILYLKFENDFENENFIKGLIWGKSKKPTNGNPEEIFIKKNTVIIWSFEKESVLKELSKKKIELEMK